MLIMPLMPQICALLLVPAGHCGLTSHLLLCQVCAAKALGPTDEGLEPQETMPLGVPRGNPSGQKTTPPVLLPREARPLQIHDTNRFPPWSQTQRPAHTLQGLVHQNVRQQATTLSRCLALLLCFTQTPRSAREHLLPQKGAQTG